jgi:hypothetical protein
MGTTPCYVTGLHLADTLSTIYYLSYLISVHISTSSDTMKTRTNSPLLCRLGTAGFIARTSDAGISVLSYRFTTGMKIEEEGRFPTRLD